jgi:hypothetical protein
MLIEQFRWLAGVIAAHPGRKVFGRTRLQKTVFLLEELGLPTHYDYSLHFYGPYSEGLNAELRLARQLDLIKEERRTGEENDYYVYQASEDAALPNLAPFLPALQAIQATPDVPLELAATYHAFRLLGYDHPAALDRLHWKKGPAKCTPENEDRALGLLKQLKLPVEG